MLDSEQPNTPATAPTSEATTTQPAATAKPAPTIEEALEQGKRAFALKKYEQAVDYYATALELM